jgi:hypothetical protein
MRPASQAAAAASTPISSFASSISTPILHRPPPPPFAAIFTHDQFFGSLREWRHRQNSLAKPRQPPGITGYIGHYSIYPFISGPTSRYHAPSHTRTKSAIGPGVRGIPLNSYPAHTRRGQPPGQAWAAADRAARVWHLGNAKRAIVCKTRYPREDAMYP